MGLVRSFQISAVFPHLTVLENVRVALQLRWSRSARQPRWRVKRESRGVMGPASLLHGLLLDPFRV